MASPLSSLSTEIVIVEATRTAVGKFGGSLAKTPAPELGAAVIQSLLIGVGFFVIGLSSAGVFTLVVILFAIVQVPAVLVTLPVIAYVLATEATAPAIVFSICTLIAGLSGVIGGMLADGLLGLFVGPVLLAVGYVLLTQWLPQHPVEGGPRIDGPAP